MVEQQLCLRGIHDQRVLQAMSDIPRHQFVAQAIESRAYLDSALPIGEGQTISQPWIVARMCELLTLRGHERILEIGTGCGYHTAVLASLCSRIYSIERIKHLHLQAKDNLRRQGINNVFLRHADGQDGWPGFAPFDAIIVTAGGVSSPRWLEQLALGGTLVMPEGENHQHRLVSFKKETTGIRKQSHEDCVFVPLLSGVQG